MSRYHIPPEIKNSWTWNPGARPQDYESSDESSDLGYDTEATDEWGDGSSSASSRQRKPKTLSEPGSASHVPVNVTQNEGAWTTVTSKSKQHAGKRPGEMPNLVSRSVTQAFKPGANSVAQRPTLGPSLAGQRPKIGLSPPAQRLTPGSSFSGAQKQEPELLQIVSSPHSQHSTAPNIQSAQPNRSLGQPVSRKPLLHVASNQSALSKGPTVRINRRLFNPSPDNPAKAAFRKREPENGKFELHKDAYEIATLEVMCKAFEEMGVRCRTFIRPPQHPKDRTILIWGDTRQVSKTISAVKEWLKHLEEAPSSIPRGKENFAKEDATTSSRYKAAQLRFEKDAATKVYQQVPDPNKIFEHTLVYLWPTDEINPHEVFGHSIEAFDPVRFRFKCHIIFDDGMGAFRVFSQDRESIVAVQNRIEEALNAIVAHSTRKSVVYLVDPPAADKIKAEVKLLQGPRESEDKPNTITPQLWGRLLNAESRNKWAQKFTELQRANNSKIEQVFVKAISVLPSYRGEVRMRVVFGTFQLHFLRRPENKDTLLIEDFLNNIQMSRTKGNMSHNIGIPNNPTAIMTKIHNATSLLIPADHTTERLEDVVPIVSGRFVVVRIDKPSVQLEVAIDTTAADGKFYEVSRTQWTRNDGKDVHVPLNISMIQLQGGPSWELKVSVEHGLDSSKIDPRMKEFADTIRPKHRDMSGLYHRGQPLLTYGKSSPGGLKPSGFEQRISFRYRILGAPQWVVEIARYDVFESQAEVPVQSSWGTTMWNSDWDTQVTSNSSLEIGESASWVPGLRTFFPNDDNEKIQGVEAGVVGFLQTVRRVSDFLHDLKATASW